MTPSQKALVLLKQQWAVTVSDMLKEAADDLPNEHQEKPGLIRAAELVRHYGTMT